MNRILIAIVASLLWSAAMFGAGWAWRGDRAEAATAHVDTAAAQGEAKAQAGAREIEHKQADTMADIGAKHEEDRAAAQAVPAAVVAGVRDGSLQLRDDLATCSTNLLSQAVAGTVERDAHAQLRAEVAGAVVQVGRDADDQLHAAQAVIAADRAEPGKASP
ncbi:hypothetical protein [Xanthomonas translucens]|uniref:hypothetical protein n=1 Tax=Xanthomonas campestris pv. translucens TaxID=343 RepID=UPI00200B290E|nr:hypothetical protein [Xanthomonas translucens]UPU47764.1 hypothetical protein MZO50_13475 [Xanthomonas translucens pv. undulosa]WLA06548.1 hypothetical protein MO329_09865 [Xanthomonas translucens]